MKIFLLLLAGILVLGGGFFAYKQYTLEKVVPRAQEKEVMPIAGGNTSTLIPELSTRPDLMKPKEDWVAVTFTGRGTLNLTGWSVRSAVSGKGFPIGTLNGKPILIQAEDEALFIHTVGTKPSYQGAPETHLYFTESSVAWGAEHDTIQLINPVGTVIDSYSY